MKLRPDDNGYGAVYKLLHWTMFAAFAAQFAVGYAMDRADDLLEGVVDRWFGGEEEGLLVVHAALGVLLLALAVTRVVWRRVVGLPPWAAGLSERERRLAHATERTLYWCMFLIPLTGLALVLISGDDWELARGEWEAPWELIDDDVLLAGHILTHLVFFTAFFLHVALVVKHQVWNRDGLLRRMV